MRILKCRSNFKLSNTVGVDNDDTLKNRIRRIRKPSIRIESGLVFRSR